MSASEIRLEIGVRMDYLVSTCFVFVVKEKVKENKEQLETKQAQQWDIKADNVISKTHGTF